MLNYIRAAYTRTSRPATMCRYPFFLGLDLAVSYLQPIGLQGVDVRGSRDALRPVVSTPAIESCSLYNVGKRESGAVEM